MQNYELTCLITLELVEEKAKQLLEGLAGQISQLGKMLKQEGPRRITLSYPIEKQKQAFLAVLEFSAEPDRLLQLKGDLEKNSQILRFLLLKKEPPASREAGPLPGEKAERKRKPGPKEKAKPVKKAAESEKKVDLAEIEKELDQIL